MRFRPAETEAHLEIALLGGFVVCTGIFGDVEAGDADAAGCADDAHQGVEYGGGSLRAVLSLCSGLEANGVDGGVYFGLADDGLDEIAEVIAPGEIEGSE